MSHMLIAEFDTKAQAVDAIAALERAGVPHNRVDTYPSIVDRKPIEPPQSEKVTGAETPVSTNGPLGHLQAIVAKVFGLGRPDEKNVSTSEPTHELNLKSPVFLSVHLEEGLQDTQVLQTLLTDAGASRVATHDAPAGY